MFIGLLTLEIDRHARIHLQLRCRCMAVDRVEYRQEDLESSKWRAGIGEDRIGGFAADKCSRIGEKVDKRRGDRVASHYHLVRVESIMAYHHVAMPLRNADDQIPCARRPRSAAACPSQADRAQCCVHNINGHPAGICGRSSSEMSAGPFSTMTALQPSSSWGNCRKGRMRTPRTVRAPDD